MLVQVNKVTVVHTSGTDRLILDLDLPNGVYPYVGTCHASLEVAAGGGEMYAARCFPEVLTETVERPLEA